MSKKLNAFKMCDKQFFVHGCAKALYSCIDGLVLDSKDCSKSYEEKLIEVLAEMLDDLAQNPDTTLFELSDEGNEKLRKHRFLFIIFSS